MTCCKKVQNFTKFITAIRILPDINFGGILRKYGFLQCVSKFGVSVVSDLHKSLHFVQGEYLI